MPGLPNVAIIELGSQTTLLIARALRELGVRSVILTPGKVSEWLAHQRPKAIILSGSASSVHDGDAPNVPHEVLSYPLFGICYGMHWITHQLGGTVQARQRNREYSKANLLVDARDHRLFAGTPDQQEVWMSHGDSVVTLPEGFVQLARTRSGTIAAMGNGNILGVQFHPEVVDTSNGKLILENFLHMAGCEGDWEPSSVVSDIRESTLKKLDGKRAIFGFSGGVDSTTMAAIIAPVLKRRLRAVTIDGGQLREGELEEIKRHADCVGVHHTVIDAREQFSATFFDTIDAQEKRRRFKKVYTALLVSAAQQYGAHAVLQGTLAPDDIESGATGGALIKEHHNVGLIMGALTQIHPMDSLFKYEVRLLAQELGLPESVWSREPFPGPGLFIRVLGIPVSQHVLSIVRWADVRVRHILSRRKLYQNLKISQLVVAYDGVKTVGVKGDARVYGGSIIVRAVETTDFMTARGICFPQEVQEPISLALTAHPEIIRVLYDPTHKPPGTIEME